MNKKNLEQFKVGKHQKLPGSLDIKTTPLKAGEFPIEKILAIIAVILAVFFPIAGVALGLILLEKFKKDPNLEGKEIAKAAVIIGTIFIAIGILFILFMTEMMFNMFR